MSTSQAAPQTIDEYIATLPKDVQQLLEHVRATIQQAAPDAQETISYNMPTFTLNGHYLVYFAAYKKHIGLYPVPLGDTQFNAELAAYTAGKGTARFPFDKPIPLDLISKIVQFRVQENLKHAETKAKKP
jgi:uncharacterized protein YdhG (YjbR/CyaY superfamily)